MTRCNFIDFDITLSGDAAPYAVAARYRRQSAQGAFACDINQGDWPTAGRIERTMFALDAKLLTDAGSRLFTALMRDDVRDLWIAARSDLDQQRIDGLRIRLAPASTPSVAALPGRRSTTRIVAKLSPPTGERCWCAE